MATTITKVANKVFNLIKDNEYIDGSPNATAIGDFIDFKTRNGAKLLKSNFADITIIDNVGGGTFTFASSQEVMIKLSELGFFLQSNSGTPGMGVNSVTGDGVSGTPEDVILTFPTPAEINAFDLTANDASDIDMPSGVETVSAAILENRGEITNLDDDKRDLTEQKNSIENDVDNNLQLVGDELAPGNNKYYGTNDAGTKGFYDVDKYIKDEVLINLVSPNFNSNVPTNIPGLTYTVSGLTEARDFIFYCAVLTNNDQNEELDFYIAKNGVTDLDQVIIETQRKNQDQSIQGTFVLDGLVNGDVITFQFDTRNDNVDIETRRIIIQSWA